MKFPVRFFTATGIMLISSCTFTHIGCEGESKCSINEPESYDIGHKLRTGQIHALSKEEVDGEKKGK